MRTALLVVYGLFFSGVSMILVSVLGQKVWGWPEWGAVFVRDIGLLLAAVMAGSILHEKLLRDEMLGLLEERLNAKAKETAVAVHELFWKHPPGMTGLRRVAEVRRNLSSYYDWVNEQAPQELFFAGRSVLHRIDADVRDRTRGTASEGVSAEDMLFRRLKEGSKITILFLDPRIEILPQLAREEGQSTDDMLRAIATSLGVCRRLYDLLQAQCNECPAGAELSIRVYKDVPYFAYHRQGTNVIVGFYFLAMKGFASPAYEPVDEVTTKIFDVHFAKIYTKAVDDFIVEFNDVRGRKPCFNQSLFGELQKYLSGKIGHEADDLLKGQSN